MKPTTRIAWIIGATVGALLLVESVRVFGQAPSARPFRLIWDDPNPHGLVVGYRVYRDTGTNWTVLATTTTNAWAVDLPPGLHTVSVTALSGQGLESDRSEPLSVGVLVAVVNLRVSQP